MSGRGFYAAKWVGRHLLNLFLQWHYWDVTTLEFSMIINSSHMTQHIQHTGPNICCTISYSHSDCIISFLFISPVNGPFLPDVRTFQNISDGESLIEHIWNLSYFRYMSFQLVRRITDSLLFGAPLYFHTSKFNISGSHILKRRSIQSFHPYNSTG